ncbi:HAD family hydrolase [Staphylococcus hyicus]
MPNAIWLMFDKDGTLIEFDQSWIKIGVQLVEDVCAYFHIKALDDVKKELGIVNDGFSPGSIMASGTLQDMITVFNQYANQDTTLYTTEKSQMLIRTREPEVILFDGVVTMLHTLKSKGYHLGILTSDNRTGMAHFFEKTQLQSLFDIVISTNGDHYEKPDPRILEPLWERGVKGRDMIMIGDTDNDMKTGRNAHALLNVGVRTGLGNQAKFDDADVILNDVTELPSILKTTH